MKKNLLLLILIQFSIFGLHAQVSLFDDSFIHEIRITSTDPDLWSNMSDDYDLFYPDVPYRDVTIEVDGTILASVGLKQKGFSSHFFVDTTKKPMKIDFEEFIEDQLYDGVKKVNLMNGVGDPAIAKDKLAYDMFRLHGIPSPRVAHAKVFIQDEYWGTYAMIEQIDKRYLKRNFADNDGNLWKNKGNSDLSWMGPDPSSYTFELQTNEDVNDWSKFIEFVDVINNSSNAEFKNALDDIFHVDEYLKILAIDLLINNWDSFVDHGRNWYLYHEPVSNKIHWLPWDYNFAFNRDPANGAGDLNILNSGMQKVLIDRVLAIPEWRAKYLNYMCELLQVNMKNERLDAKLLEQLDLIIVDWDSSNAFFNTTELDLAINGPTWFDPLFFIDNQGMIPFIADRSAIVEAELASLNYTCIPVAPAINAQDVVINEFMSDNDNNDIWLDQDGENEDWIELYNNTAVDIDLTNYFLSDHSSFMHKWEFPENTIIPSEGYLIIWPDKDIDQNGLHTQFKLDKDEGNIFLSYLDGSIIDSVVWVDKMDENSSLSRIPNGTGSFQNVTVTFNANNDDILFVNDLLSESSIKIFPNPTSNWLTIKVNALTSETQFNIIDVTGRQVYSRIMDLKEERINLSKLASGLYIINLKNETSNYSQKILIK
jgi:hypothetical protein